MLRASAKTLAIAMLFLGAGTLRAADPSPSATPKAAPLTRPELKQALEALKHRTSRLPLPAPEEGKSSANNGRARQIYLPAEWQTPNSRNTQRGPNEQFRPSDPAMTLDYVFTVQMFWISARLNNCHY